MGIELTDEQKSNFSELKEGFYILYKKSDEFKSDACLVKVYTNPDTEEKGVGFGIWDGTGFVPMKDIGADSIFEKVDLSDIS